MQGLKRELCGPFSRIAVTGAVTMGASAAEVTASLKRAAIKEMKLCDQKLEGKSTEEALTVLKVSMKERCTRRDDMMSLYF